MSHKYYVFTNPPDLTCQLFHDSGWNGIAYAQKHPSGRNGQVFDIPDTVRANEGARLYIFSEGLVPIDLRGILIFADETYAYMQCDDFTLSVAPTTEPEPPTTEGPPDNHPLTIINWVYMSGQYNLATHDGCGLFTEKCCEELHVRNSELWGHIRKPDPGQNQYNGHAVDALQCLGGPEYGIWDIIHDSVSPNATPAYNNKGQAEPTLYCYPAGSCMQSTQSTVIYRQSEK